MRDIPATPTSAVVRAREIARRHGLNFVYTGNVYDPEGQGTYCPECAKPVIGRSGYAITSWGLGQGGYCTGCGASVAGVFEAAPGDWGERRRPVTVTHAA